MIKKLDTEALRQKWSIDDNYCIAMKINELITILN